MDSPVEQALRELMHSATPDDDNVGVIVHMTPVGSSPSPVHSTAETGGTSTGQIRIDSRGYGVFVERGTQWRSVSTEDLPAERASVFRAACVDEFGNLQMREQRSGTRPHSRTGTISRQAGFVHWNTASTRRLRRFVVTTTAQGLLGVPAFATTLTRTCTDLDGTLIRTADAKTTQVQDPDRPGHDARLTSGTVRYADGNTGTFKTVVGYTDSRSDLDRVIGGHSGSRTYVQPDGTKVTERSELLPGLGAGTKNTTETFKETKDAATGKTTVVTTKRESILSPTGQTTVSSETRSETYRFNQGDDLKKDVNPGGKLFESDTHTTFKDAQGNVTTVDETTVADRGGARSEAKHVEHADGSAQLVVVSQDENGHAVRRTQTFDKQGNQTGDKRVQVTIGPGGDWVPWDGHSLDTSTEDSATIDEDGKVGSGSSSSESSDTSGDPPPVVGDDDDGDPHEEGDELESDDGADGGYGDDAGHPGLSWDGQSDGPLSFLGDRAKTVLGNDGDPYRQLDELGHDDMVPLLARALRVAANPPSSGDGDGLGDDVTGAATPVSLTLGTSAHSVADPWGDWGDFSNPKAHREILKALKDQELRVTTVDAKTKEITVAALDLASRKLDLQQVVS